MAHIAIVDDSRLARTFLLNHLKPLGHTLIEVEPSSLFDTLKILRAQPPMLILMDYLMPNCPGANLVRACREDPQLGQTRILVITAHRDEAVVDRLKSQGVSEVLFKPLQPAVLVATVASLLEERS